MVVKRTFKVKKGSKWVKISYDDIKAGDVIRVFDGGKALKNSDNKTAEYYVVRKPDEDSIPVIHHDPKGNF